MKKIWFVIMLGVVLYAVSACKKEEDNSEQAAIDKALIEAYISDNQLNAQSTASGLYYVIRESGNDEHPTVYSTVTVAYKGYLLNGDVFDESLAYTERLSLLIQGWREGIPLIGKGGKIKLMVPSALGYGGEQAGNIPANSVLIFDITLYNFTN
ncbi:MAG: FKBP-type peptidyl-prolyl cis-trans isomerase [Bacteroidales bacterium]|jgi:FKBP-type peptidyl-prolyl cis-trans isomerase FkpA|nr:FKBP-type peptidyl-prolyl cis-trans isomerase [Bacteroidales bacterium]